MTHRESEFDDRQVALLLALRDLQADLGPHGQPMSEATDIQNSTNFRAKDKDRPRGHYRVIGPNVDYAEQALTLAKQQYYDALPDSHDRSADLWAVEWAPDK